MKTLIDRTFVNFYDFPNPAIIENLSFENCQFRCCDLSAVETPDQRSTLRGSTFLNCSLVECGLGPAILEDVYVENLSTEVLFYCWGTVFRHVTLKGNFTDWTMYRTPPFPVRAVDQNELFIKANQAFYTNVDWALDISEANFVSCSIEGIPARLIRRDPETQKVITRAQALEIKRRGVHLTQSISYIAIEDFLQLGTDDTILIAPKAHKNFKLQLADLEKLQQLGLVES